MWYKSAMSRPSSEALHPRFGARFLFELREQNPLRYDLSVYLAGGETYRGSLGWDPQGQAELCGLDSGGWWREEALKLARVLRRQAKPSLLRWRPEPEPL